MSLSVSPAQPRDREVLPARPPVEPSAEHLPLRVHFSPAFRTTEDLTPGHDFVGQERARAALELGLGIPSSGFNIFVSGLTGTQGVWPWPVGLRLRRSRGVACPEPVEGLSPNGCFFQSFAPSPFALSVA